MKPGVQDIYGFIGVIARNDCGDGRDRAVKRQDGDAAISKGSYESIGDCITVAKMGTVQKRK